RSLRCRVPPGSPLFPYTTLFRSRDPDEAVATELQEDGRQQHGAHGRRRGVGVGEPGVHWEHRHLDGETEEEAAEHQEGEGAGEGTLGAELGQYRDVERPLRQELTRSQVEG